MFCLKKEHHSGSMMVLSYNAFQDLDDKTMNSALNQNTLGLCCRTTSQSIMVSLDCQRLDFNVRDIR